MLIDIVSNAMVAMMLPMLMFGQGASAVLMNIVMVSDILLTWVVLAPLIIVSDSRCRYRRQEAYDKIWDCYYLCCKMLMNLS